MSLNRWAKRRDENEPDIFEALEKLGAKVVRLDRPCDCFIGYGGLWVACEIKMPTGAKWYEDQVAFREEAQERELPYAVLTTVEEAVELIQRIHALSQSVETQSLMVN